MHVTGDREVGRTAVWIGGDAHRQRPVGGRPSGGASAGRLDRRRERQVDPEAVASNEGSGSQREPLRVRLVEGKHDDPAS
jgi:hypothetical protein